jgi:hypothetical protein
LNHNNDPLVPYNVMWSTHLTKTESPNRLFT